MDRKRVRMVVEVDLDPIVGAFHTPESAREVVQAQLRSQLPHYNPVVELLVKD